MPTTSVPKKKYRTRWGIIILSACGALVVIGGAYFGRGWWEYQRAIAGRPPLIDERTYAYKSEVSDIEAAGYRGVSRQRQERLAAIDRFLLPKEYYRTNEVDPNETKDQPNESYNIVAVGVMERKDGIIAPLLDQARVDQIVASGNPSLSYSPDAVNYFVDGRMKIEFESGKYLISVSGPDEAKVKALALIMARKYAP